MAYGESIRLFLIRHGETTDNVAGLYGGVRNSPLTNHGYQQACRLGSWLAERGVRFTHIFSSDLSRAFKTAEAIRTAQPQAAASETRQRQLQVVALKEIQEQNFGSFEGQPFYVRSSEKGKSLSLEPNFQEAESRESLVERANAFLTEHLMPVLSDPHPEDTPPVVAVVSHGVMLSTLWRCILARQLPNTIKLDPEVSATLDPISLEYLGGWSNTGNLELELQEIPLKHTPNQLDGQSATASTEQASYIPAEDQPATADIRSTASPVRAKSRFSIVVKAVNRKEHLQRLKRTGGGVGSAKHDEGQKSIETFFKRQK